MKEGMIGILILAAIACYCYFVIRRKVRDVKAGKFCSCGCDGCSGKCGKAKQWPEN